MKPNIIMSHEKILKKMANEGESKCTFTDSDTEPADESISKKFKLNGHTDLDFRTLLKEEQKPDDNIINLIERRRSLRVLSPNISHKYILRKKSPNLKLSMYKDESSNSNFIDYSSQMQETKNLHLITAPSSKTEKIRKTNTRGRPKKRKYEEPELFFESATFDDEDETSSSTTEQWADNVEEEDVELFNRAQIKAAEKVSENNSNSGIKEIAFGQYAINVWYESPFPLEYQNLHTLHICEFCLKYFKTRKIFKIHEAKCAWKHPPGDEIYRQDNLAIFEVEGKKNRHYCQNLCLLSKCFLRHKTLYYDIEPFLFYILTICDASGYHIIGYFSKENNRNTTNNVACILTFPQYQRMGYGQFLISFSYLLTKKEKKVATPERPFSDLGQVAYEKYWKTTLLNYLKNVDADHLTIEEICKKNGICPEDIIDTIKKMNLFKVNMGKLVIVNNRDSLKEHIEKRINHQSVLEVDSEFLKWMPFK